MALDMALLGLLSLLGLVVADFCEENPPAMERFDDELLLVAAGDGFEGLLELEELLELFEDENPELMERFEELELLEDLEELELDCEEPDEEYAETSTGRPTARERATTNESRKELRDFIGNLSK